MRPRIVVLGLMSVMPVGGVVWQTLHYLIGLRRLGYDVFYVETDGRVPAMLMTSEDDDPAARACLFLDRVLRRFDLGDRWAYVAFDGDGGRHTHGMSEERLHALYASAEIILNLHGATYPLPEMVCNGRLVYLETDPVQLQVELSDGDPTTIEFLEAHCAFFTFGENIGAPDCTLPVPERFVFTPTRQPVVLDLWPAHPAPGETYTTVGNWRQAGREVTFDGAEYTWSKHHEWEKVLDLPGRTGLPFELALSRCWESDRVRLEDHGWRVADSLGFSMDADAYRDYVTASRGELTVAKDQNVRFTTGWFSDRSATYLAAGRPVVTQETGFSNVLPTGHGLFGFTGAAEAAAALEAIEADLDGNRRAAADIAREFFAADVVLRALLDRGGVELTGTRGRPRREADPVLPESAPLEPVSRRPTVLAPETVAAAEAREALREPVRTDAAYPLASIVMVTYGGGVFSRLALDSVLASTDHPNYEVVVVDNGSSPEALAHLRAVAAAQPHVRLVENGENRGFPAATNQGLREARGDTLVLLNNDVLVAPGWLSRLCAHLEKRGEALAGPVTNRIGNEAEIRVDYGTWDGFVRFAAERAARLDGRAFPIHTLTMFCLAMPRSVLDRLGPLDERFGVGTLEDDDFSLRARRAGLPLLCAEDVVVHHFGESSFGELVASGERDRVLEHNRRSFAEKWGEEWRAYGRRPDPADSAAADRLRAAVEQLVPAEASVLVISRGDDALLDLGGRPAWHFPRGDDGGWAGHYPADGPEAVGHLEALRGDGAQFLVVPRTSLWWLEHYAELREHLGAAADPVLDDPDTGAIFALGRARAPVA